MISGHSNTIYVSKNKYPPPLQGGKVFGSDSYFLLRMKGMILKYLGHLLKKR